MTVTFVAALDEDDAIGRAAGGLPWRLPDDAAAFRDYCRGKWMLLGRRTFDEMSGWFTDQVPMVLTRSPESIAAPARAVSSVDDALRLATAGGAAEVVVAGGATVYSLALPRATRLILTRVHTRTKAERFFPVLDPSRWRRVRSRFHPADARHEFAFTVSTFERFPS